MGEILDQEVAVFEVAEQSQAYNNGEQHPGAALPLLVCLGEPASCKPVDHCRQPEQEYERRIPSRVKDVAGNEQVDLLHPSMGRALSAG